MCLLYSGTILTAGIGGGKAPDSEAESEGGMYIHCEPWYFCDGLN